MTLLTAACAGNACASRLSDAFVQGACIQAGTDVSLSEARLKLGARIVAVGSHVEPEPATQSKWQSLRSGSAGWQQPECPLQSEGALDHRPGGAGKSSLADRPQRMGWASSTLRVPEYVRARAATAC